MSKLLEIKDLHASIGGKEILKGVNLVINEGEVHAIMGPNGAGKSTLSAVLTGNPAYEVTSGEVYLKGQDLLAMPAEIRARAGVFLSFQYPVEIPGVSMTNFMRAAINAKREYEGKEPISPKEFLALMREKKKLLELPDKLNNRSVNEGFSGGEKKKNEIFQMAMLEPCLSILDETDSGLDIDALRIVAEGVNKLKTPQNASIVITHYQRLLDYIVPERISKGEIFERVFVNEEVNLQIDQEAGSHVKIHVINASFSITVNQLGEGCITEIYGLENLHGEESVTAETHVTHAVGGGTSNQLVKFVLADRARGSFIGDLKIAPDAQKTEAHQTNRNLLLSEDAEMRTRPQLEIYADDVKATHGASTGQLDESALFYMQQRGIDKQKARQLLVNAFMKDVLATISDEKIREQLLNAVDSEIE